MLSRGKKNLIQFVQTVTNKSSPNYVVPAKPVATFDNDGTLWVEQPIYTQLIFAMDRERALAPMHPEWKSEKPFSIIIHNNKQAINSLILLVKNQLLLLETPMVTKKCLNGLNRERGLV